MSYPGHAVHAHRLSGTWPDRVGFFKRRACRYFLSPAHTCAPRKGYVSSAALSTPTIARVGPRVFVPVSQARAARQVEARGRAKKGKGMLGNAAEGVKGVVTKGGAEVGGAIARGGGVIARGGADILAAGPNLAAGLITSHAEVRARIKTKEHTPCLPPSCLASFHGW